MKDDMLINVTPTTVGPPKVVKVIARKEKPGQWLQENRMNWLEKLEALAATTEDERVALSVYKTLLSYTDIGQKKAQFNQSNIKQELHLHGNHNLPDFNNLPTSKLRELLGQIEQATAEVQGERNE